MEEKNKRSTDAEAVAALIWLAFVVPEEVLPLEDDGKAYLSFRRALDLYADARSREDAEREALLREAAEEKEQLLAELEAEQGRLRFVHSGDVQPPVPDPDSVPEPQPPEHTHTHTHTHTQAGRAAPKSDDGGIAPAPFVGKGSGEKRQIFERLTAYCAAHGLGAACKIAKASNGAITDDDVRAMKDGLRVPIQKWRILSAALDWLEEKK